MNQQAERRLSGQQTGRRISSIVMATQPAEHDPQDIHPMFTYCLRTMKALLLMNGPLFITGFRQKIEQQHPLSREEKIQLTEMYRNVDTYSDFCEILFGVNDITGVKRSNYLPFWQTMDSNGEDDSVASTNQYKLFLQAVINNHGQLSYVDKISSTLTVLGLEPQFYAESSVTSWDR